MAEFVIDFETYPIEPRPDYPPKPVGVALQPVGQQASYLAWGHPAGGNNSTLHDARRHLESLWKKHTLIFHNAKFDLDVADTHLGLRPPPASRFRDTLIEAFLYDSNREQLSLKPMSEELLGMPPTEQKRLYHWIAANVPEAKRSIEIAEKKGNRPPDLGAWIAFAPGNLVGPYAKGDVKRTTRLHNFFIRSLDDQEMEAYERERILLLHLLEEEKQGVPVDVPRLEQELERGEKNLDLANEWLRKRLKLPDGEKLTPKKVADAMESLGMVDEWILTDKGNRSTAFDNLKQVCQDEVFMDVWAYRSKLATQVQTFARPWLRVAESTERIYPVWNQVRQAGERERGMKGARTGRLSSSPNLQNVPVVPDPIARTYNQWKKFEGSDTPALMVPISRSGNIQLLNMREFIVAPRGYRIIDRDYSQQELRILGHFEGQVLLQAYLTDPEMDIHALAQALISRRLGRPFRRKPIKNIGFGIIYGMGIGLMAEKIEEEFDLTKELKQAYLEIFPGMKELIKGLKNGDVELRTWGGRRFKVEEPKMVKGQRRTFEYKLINTLIQGSAADCTKQAMVNYFEHEDRDGRLMLSVHDQLSGLCKTKAAKRQMRILKDCMESVEFRVPMLSTGNIVTKWSDAK